MNLTYKVQVDWDNSGTWVDATDTQPALNTGVGIRGGRDQPRLFAPLRPGSAGWRADNSGLEFSDPNGTIGDDLKPRRPMRVIAVDTDDGDAEYPLFTGFIDKWKVSVPAWPMIVADFGAVDLLARLAQIKISTPVYTDINTADALDAVLDTAGLPYTLDDDTGRTTLGLWCVEDVSALDALNEIALLEGGQIYLMPDGRVRFFERYARQDITTAYTLSQDTTVKAVEWRTDTFQIINRVAIDVETFALGTEEEIWNVDGTFTLAQGETITFAVTSDTPFASAEVPDHIFDGDYTLLSGAVSFALDRTSGKKVLLTATGGTGGGSFSDLRVRATPYVKTVTPVFVEDSDSIAEYGPSDYKGTRTGFQSALDGLAAAQYLLLRYANPRPAVAVTLRISPSDDAVALLLALEYGTRVYLDLPFVGVEWYGFVDAVQHNLKSEMHELIVTVEREPRELGSVLMLDDDIYGLLDSNMAGW